MAKVRVFNDNVHPYSENFKGELIQIPAKGSIVMDYDDGHSFRGTFKPPMVGPDGEFMPEGYKMIRVERMTEEDEKPAAKAEEFQCFGCKYKGTSTADLAEHSKAAHSEQLVVDELAEAELAKRGPGRPKKTA